MTEIDLYIAWSEIKTQVWSQVQFMASISFGLVALAHFSDERLSKVVVVILSILYSGFFLHSLTLVRTDLGLAQAVYNQAAELAALEAATPTIKALANYPSGFTYISPFFFTFVIPCVYFGSIFYLVHQYRRIKQSKK